MLRGYLGLKCASWIILVVVSLLMVSTSLVSGLSYKSDPTTNINQYNFSDIDYLIITSDELVDAVVPFQQWKLQKGLRTSVMTVENIAQEYSGSSLVQKIRNCIKETRGVQWVLLAGGSDFIPTPKVFFDDDYPYDGDTVVCDQFYTNLFSDWEYDGSNDWFIKDDPLDWHTSVYIGRFPAIDQVQLSNFISNSINYERNPSAGDWMTRALMAGAFACFDEDYDNDSIVDWEDIDGNRFNNWIKNNVIPSDWSTTLLGEDDGLFPSNYPYDFPLTEENVVSELERGAGVGILCGHGSSSAIYRMIFEKDFDNDSLFDYDRPSIYMNGTVDFAAMPLDIASMTPFLNASSGLLSSNDKRGFYFFLACNNGNFDYDKFQTCLATKVLEKYAIGTIASSRVSWTEDFWQERNHPGWYNEGLAGRFFEQIFKYGVTRPGEAFAEAKMDYTADMKQRNNSSDPVVLVPSIENKVLAQFNLLGDPEIPLWLDTPKQLDVIIHYSSIEVRDRATNMPLERAVVTLYNDTYYWSSETFSNGEVNLFLSADDLSSLNFTVYKEGYIPYTYVAGISDHQTDETSNYSGIIEALLLLSVISIILKSKRK